MLEVSDVDLTVSGPVELFLLCFIAAWTCVVVSVMLVVCSLSASYLCEAKKHNIKPIRMS